MDSLQLLDLRYSAAQSQEINNEDAINLQSKDCQEMFHVCMKTTEHWHFFVAGSISFVALRMKATCTSYVGIHSIRWSRIFGGKGERTSLREMEKGEAYLSLQLIPNPNSVEGAMSKFSRVQHCLHHHHIPCYPIQ